MRWALRLVDDASDSLTALCVVRDPDGRWLAGRRAAWVSTWADRWALGGAGRSISARARPDAHARASGGVAARARGAHRGGVARAPERVAMLVGLARVPHGAEPDARPRDDDWAWWPADVSDWPAEADERLKLMARMLG